MQANTLYVNTGRIAQRCGTLAILASVENPSNSLAWLADGLDDVLRRCIDAFPSLHARRAQGQADLVVVL